MSTSSIDKTMHPAFWFGPCDDPAQLEERCKLDHEEAFERHQRAVAAGEWSPFEYGPFFTLDSTRLHWARWLRELRRPMTETEQRWSSIVVAENHDVIVNARLSGKTNDRRRELKLDWSGCIRLHRELSDPEVVVWADWFASISDRWF